MQILSALDSISPAFKRTKLVLFSPYRFGRTWKLAATGYLSGFGVVFIPFPLLALGLWPLMHEQANAQIIMRIVAGASAAFTLLYLVVFYLCSRLRFAFFDIVLNRGEFVAPAWRKYGGATLRWTLFKILLGSVVTAAAAWPVASMGPKFFAAFQGLDMAAGQSPAPQFMHAIFALYAAFFLVYAGIAVFYLVSSLLSDFIVPQIALEDATLAEALKRVAQFVRREPGAVALYAILKVGLFFVGAVAVGIALYAAVLAVILVAVLVGGLIGLLLHLLHVPTSVLTGLAVALGGTLYFFASFYLMTIANGTLFTFLEAYLLYFLGGRYPMLGEALERSTPVQPSNEPAYGVAPYGASPAGPLQG